MFKLLITSTEVTLETPPNFTPKGKEDLYLTTYVDNQKTSLSFPLDALDGLYDMLLKAFKRGAPVSLQFRPEGLDTNPIKAFSNVRDVSIEDKREKAYSLRSSFPFKVEQAKESYGISDYRFVYDYMPSWSTAYKFPYSTHTKTVEPLFSNLTYIRDGVKRRLKGYPAGEGFRKTKDLKPYGAESYITLSDAEHSYIQSYLYLNDSQRVIDFGATFNDIYITPLEFVDKFDIVIDGEYNNAFFSERLTITSEGTILLKNKYNKIFNILVDPASITSHEFPPDLNLFSFTISNYLEVSEFSYQDRKDTFLSIDEDIIIQSNKDNLKTHNIFQIPYVNFNGLHIDNQDNIYMVKGDEVYTGKLDAKLHIPIPLDPSYNNSKYIEECKISHKISTIELFLPAFIEHTQQNQVSVKVITPTSTTYLTDDFRLVPSDSPIYLDTSIIKFGKSITLDFKLDEEWTVIRMEDRKNIYSVSHLISVPSIELVMAYNIKELLLDSLDVDKGREVNREADYAVLIFINDIPYIKYKFDNEPLFSYMLVPLDVLEDYKLHSTNNLVKEGSEVIIEKFLKD